jgi:tRNA G18 (ribose-2'-O)-methylase SpoU
MNVQRISSLHTPGLEPYLTLRENTQHWRDGFFVAESEKVVFGLIDSGLSVLSFLMSEEWFAALESKLSHERLRDATIFIASDELLHGIVGYQLHKKIMAIGRIPENPSLEQLVRRSADTKRIVALEGIADAENMGTIMRNAAAFAIWSLIVGRDSCSPYLRRSVRVSMAAMFSLTIHITENLAETLRTLQAEFGFSIIGATPRGGMQTLETYREKPVCLLFGSEAHGLTKETMDVCDGLYSIPMSQPIDSLNVSNAVAVTLYESLRQR